MKQFDGFPAKMEFTSIPNLFFSTLLTEINDIIELKATLFILAALYRKKGYPRFVTLGELLADQHLMGSLKNKTKRPEEVLKASLDKATKRGSILHIELDRDGKTEDIYLLNTAKERETEAKIKSGELSLPELKTRNMAYTKLEETPDIFVLYEQNIGMLTPMIAEELRDAERTYPTIWIREAIKEAVDLNKRSWRYIAAILKHWAEEGKGNGTYRRHHTKKAASDKYTKGKYGHMVWR